MSDLSIEWLRGLAEKGGKGVVNNIDARSLGRIADELEEWKQAASVEAGLRREYVGKTDALVKDLAEAVKLLDALLGLEKGSGAAALAFIERHNGVVGDVRHG